MPGAFSRQHRRCRVRSSRYRIVEGIPLEIAVPAPLRAQLLEVGPLEGEHRHASIAFVRYSGTDEIIETEGPDAAADALEVLVRAVQPAADDHNVTFLESDIDRDGGRIILVVGRAADVRRRRGAAAPHRARRSSTPACRSRCTSASARGASSPARSARRFRRTYTSSATRPRSPRG